MKTHKLKPGKILWVECGLYKGPKARSRTKKWPETTCKNCLSHHPHRTRRP
jgi:hypothetical protein